MSPRTPPALADGGDVRFVLGGDPLDGVGWTLDFKRRTVDGEQMKPAKKGA